VIVVSDTSPVRGLIAIGKIELLQKLFLKVIIPGAVELELLRIKSLQPEILLFLKQSWVEVKQVKHSEEYALIRKHLDEGESEAIVLAQKLHADLLLMDENKGRRIAKDLNLKVLGLIGILIKSKRLALIGELKPVLDELINKHGFWIQNDLYRDILKSVEEN